MKRMLFSLCLIFSFGYVFSQIHPNEKLVYAASYNMGGLMTQLAQVTIETETLQTSKKKFLHLSLEATTFSKWDRFFKIRDLYESYVNPATLKSSLYKRSINEGGYIKTEKYLFKTDGKTVISITKNKNKKETERTFTIGSSTQDVVSMIFKLRTLNFNSLQIGQSKLFLIIFDEKEYPVSIKFMGKETISAGNLGTKECYKVSIAAKTNVLKGKDKNIIWLTVDEKRTPVLVKFSIPVGVGQLKLSNASSL